MAADASPRSLVKAAWLPKIAGVWRPMTCMRKPRVPKSVPARVSSVSPSSPPPNHIACEP